MKQKLDELGEGFDDSGMSDEQFLLAASSRLDIMIKICKKKLELEEVVDKDQN